MKQNKSYGSEQADEGEEAVEAEENQDGDIANSKKQSRFSGGASKGGVKTREEMEREMEEML